VLLEAVDPRVADTVGELLLLPPQLGLGLGLGLVVTLNLSLSLSITLTRTLTLTLSLTPTCRHSTSLGRYGSSGVSKAARSSHFSMNCVSSPALRSLNSGEGEGEG